MLRNIEEAPSTSHLIIELLPTFIREGSAVNERITGGEDRGIGGAVGVGGVGLDSGGGVMSSAAGCGSEGLSVLGVTPESDGVSVGVDAGAEEASVTSESDGESSVSGVDFVSESESVPGV